MTASCAFADLGIGANWTIPPSCSSLDLSFHAIGPEGSFHLAAALVAGKEHGARLTGLNLTWSAIGLAGLAAITEAIGTVQGVEILDLRGNWLGDEGAAMLADAMQRNRLPSLQELHLRWNRIFSSGADALARALPSTPLLRVADLGANWLGDLGASHIADACAQLPRLNTLRLDNNGIGEADTSLAAFARMLSSADQLRVLDLGGNELDDVGTRKLAAALRENTHLEFLGLAMNSRVGNAAAMDLAGVVRAHPRLAHIDLRGTGVGDPGADSLLSASEQSKILARLELDASGGAPGLGEDRLQRVRALGKGRGGPGAVAAAASAGSPRRPEVDAEDAYWRQVYPLATLDGVMDGRTAAFKRPPNFFYITAPAALLEVGCESHAWARCRLDNYFGKGVSPPRIEYASVFSPFRMPPGACMRSQFVWDRDVAGWRAVYPYSAGAPDKSWVEVSHTREQGGGAWMYLSAGSGVFWNCGRSLRARNKVDAALQLLGQGLQVGKGAALRRLATSIEADEKGACDEDHCRTFMSILRSNRSDRNDNCYGRCGGSQPLAEWLERAAWGNASTEWWYDHMSASSVFDYSLLKWAKRLKYDSVQLTMQPQVWCGLGWTTEILDLRVRRHRITDIIPSLSLRDPFQPAARGAPCIVRGDNQSRKAFQLCIYCEGSVMERVSRCLADVSGGRPKWTIYSNYPRPRFEHCMAGS